MRPGRKWRRVSVQNTLPQICAIGLSAYVPISALMPVIGALSRSVDAYEFGDRAGRAPGLIIADNGVDLSAAEATLHMSGNGA